MERELDNPGSHFARLVDAIKSSNAWRNGKLFFNPFNNLHFTFHFKDAGAIDAGKIAKALLRGCPYAVQVRGFTFFPESPGRVFLRVCPEIVGESNGDRINRQVLVQQASGALFISASGFLNLKSNLDDEEKMEIKSILDRFCDNPLFEFRVDHLDVIWVADDFLIKHWPIDTIPLS